MCDKLDHQLIDENSKAQLLDGRPDEPSPYRTVTDYKYMLKLYHLVDNRIHTRSIGSYLVITQQPLGGKTQLGSQRPGETEVRTLEAHGATYVLQEVLAVKSDGVQGRVKVYGAIVRGEDLSQPGISESFRALMQGMHSLRLNVEVLDFDGHPLDTCDDADETPRGIAELDFDLSKCPNALGMVSNMEEI